MTAPELCDNCADLAAYAIDEGDGNYCSYACNVCIELWFPDGPDPRFTQPLPTRPDPGLLMYPPRQRRKSWWRRR